jgi:hypothetical protein
LLTSKAKATHFFVSFFFLELADMFAAQRRAYLAAERELQERRIAQKQAGGAAAEGGGVHALGGVPLAPLASSLAKWFSSTLQGVQEVQGVQGVQGAILPPQGEGASEAAGGAGGADAEEGAGVAGVAGGADEEEEAALANWGTWLDRKIGTQFTGFTGTN